MNTSTSRSARGFTVIELLVVIAIIAVLMSILIPVIARSRRGAIVLASPIAYVGTDKNVHLTNRAGFEVEIKVPTEVKCPICHTPPTWSPSGQTLAMRMVDPKGKYTAVVEPMSGKVRKYAEVNDQNCFSAWIDSSRFLTMDRKIFNMTSVHTGDVLQKISRSTNAMQFLFVSPAPVTANTPFVAVMMRGKRNMVGFLRKDLSPGKVLWAESIATGAGSNQHPRIDANGQFVAWSQRRPDSKSAFWIAIRDVHEESARPLIIVGKNYNSAYFCDFTEDGKILANVSNDNKTWKLVVIDRVDRTTMEIPTEVPPQAGVVASWRKYMRY